MELSLASNTPPADAEFDFIVQFVAVMTVQLRTPQTPPLYRPEFEIIVQFINSTTEQPSANNAPPASAKFDSSVQSFATTLASMA